MMDIYLNDIKSNSDLFQIRFAYLSYKKGKQGFNDSKMVLKSFDGEVTNIEFNKLPKNDIKRSKYKKNWYEITHLWFKINKL